MVQGFRERSVMQRRTTAYVLALVLVAALVAGALLFAGYELESPRDRHRTSARRGGS